MITLFGRRVRSGFGPGDQLKKRDIFWPETRTHPTTPSVNGILLSINTPAILPNRCVPTPVGSHGERHAMAELCVIFNPAAGRGRAKRRLEELMRVLGPRAEYQPTKHPRHHPRHAEELAEKAAQRGFS